MATATDDKVQTYLRACAGCPGYDDHPRAQVSYADGSIALFHHDCVPDEVMDDEQRQNALAATKVGDAADIADKGDQARAAIRKRALARREDPADKPNRKA